MHSTQCEPVPPPQNLNVVSPQNNLPRKIQPHLISQNPGSERKEFKKTQKGTPKPLKHVSLPLHRADFTEEEELHVQEGDQKEGALTQWAQILDSNKSLNN